jgi:hypothetical protein
MKQFLITIALLSFASLCPGQTKKALKEIEKNEWQKAEQALLKGLQKDSLDALSHHVYSILLSNGWAPQFDIVKSSEYNKKAQKLFSNLDEKELSKLEKSDLSQRVLESQKKFIDSVAFILALQKGTEQGYINFIELFPDARQIHQAIKARDRIAFTETQNTNTITSYRNFLNKYPDADQVPKAQEIFDKLLYEEQAKNADLEKMISFLKEYPDNPYNQEIEFNVFKQISGFFSEENLFQFIETLPESKYAQLAYEFLYHLKKDNRTRWEFLTQNSKYSKADSLRTLLENESGFLIPIIENQRVGFINSQGNMVISPDFQDPNNALKCSLISGDLIQVKNGSQISLFNRSKDLVFQTQADSVKDLGNGFIRISVHGRQGLIHKNGYVFFEPSFRDIELLSNSIFKFRRAEGWGLMDPFQKIIISDNLTSITGYGKIAALEKNGKLGLFNIEELYNQTNAQPSQFPFEDVEQLTGGEFLSFSANQEVLLDENLKEIIPAATQEISHFKNYWISKGEVTTKLFSHSGKILVDSIQNYSIYGSKLGYKRNGRWSIFEIAESKNTEYDSLKILSDNIYVSFSEKKNLAHFENNQLLDLSNSRNYKLLNQQSPLGRSFLLTFDEDGVKRLYNSEGKKILAGWFDEVKPINDFLFLVEEKKLSGLSDSTGQNVLPIEYEGIGTYNNGFVATLKKGKFGVFHYPSRKVIQPQFDTRPQPYGDSLVIASKNGKSGIINVNNKIILPFDYTKIEFWSNTQALVSKGNNFKLKNLQNDDSISLLNLKRVKLPNAKEVIIYSTSLGSGVASPGIGDLIPAVFTEINFLRTENEVIFVCGKFLEETDLHIIAYFDLKGELIWRSPVSREDYYKYLCLENSAGAN